MTIAAVACCLAAHAGVFRDSLGVMSKAGISASELLVGKVSGVRVSSIDGNPVGGTNVNIRGINSLRGDNQPLWIVDGVMVSTDLNQNLDAFWQYGEASYTAPLNPLAFLNPDDIESIEVLKDISSTAIDGARGASGVIIVKTKSPSSSSREVHWSSGVAVNTDATSPRTGLGPAIGSSHLLSVSGTGNTASYNISGTFRSVKGIFPRNGSDYGTLRANFETKTNKTVWFGLGSLLSRGASDAVLGTNYLGNPSMTLAIRNESLFPSDSFEGWKSDYDDYSEDIRALASTYLRINILPSLYFKADAGVDFQSNHRSIWYGLATPFGAATEDNPNGGRAGHLVSSLLGWNASAQLVFSRYFAEEHRLAVQLKAELTGNRNHFNTLNGQNFIVHDLRADGLKYGNYDYYNHAFSHTWSHLGVSAAVDYSYRDIFMLNALLRRDSTPRYGRFENVFYPAAEARLDLGKMFLESDGFLSGIELKGGYGRGGSEKYVPYDLYGYYLSGSWYTPSSDTTPFFDGLDKLLTSEWHVGAALSLLANRIRVQAIWFDRSTEDAFRMYQLGHGIEGKPSASWVWGGCERVFEQKSGIRNRGVELDLDALVLRSGSLTWEISANIALNDNAVTATDPNDFKGRKVGRGIVCTCNALSLPVSSLYGYRVDDYGNLRDLTGEGIVNEADMEILGGTVPRVYGGLCSTVSFGNLSFGLTLDGAAGHHIANINALVQKGVTGPDGVIAMTETYVERGDFLRIGEASLRYRLPHRVVSLKDVTFSLGCRNAAVLSRYSGWNPDVNSFGVSSLSNGLDYGSYPLVRSFVLGVSANF